MATFYRSALPSFVVPVLVFALLALRRADWEALLARTRPKPRP